MPRHLFETPDCLLYKYIHTYKHTCTKQGHRTHNIVNSAGVKLNIVVFHCSQQKKTFCWSYGQIHLPHLRICKYFMDDSSVNFHDKVFLHFLQKFGKKWRKTLSWKFMDESSVKYLWIHKWGRWIQPMCRSSIKMLSTWIWTICAL